LEAAGKIARQSGRLAASATESAARIADRAFVAAAERANGAARWAASAARKTATRSERIAGNFAQGFTEAYRESRRAQLMRVSADPLLGLGNEAGGLAEGISGGVKRVLGDAEVAAANAAGSAAHNAARWNAYQARGGRWGYERWSRVYERNMRRATDANKVVDAYHARLGWGKREVAIDVEGVPRRLDIADSAGMRGREIKSGYQNASQENLWEIQRDQILRNAGWDIRWHFEGRASKPLLRALDDAGIPYTFGAR
jgi:hypothetical protein